MATAWKEGDYVTFEKCKYGMGDAVKGDIGIVHKVESDGVVLVNLVRLNRIYRFDPDDLTPTSKEALSIRSLQINALVEKAYEKYLEYWQKLATGYDLELSTLSNQYEEAHNRLWDIQSRIQEINTLQRSFTAKGVSDSNRMEFKTTLNRLFTSDKGYESISRDGAHLLGITKEVVIKYKEWKISLGKYVVRIDIIGKKVIITSYEAREGEQHPHINSSGRPCWGTYEGAVVDMLTQHKHLRALEIVTDFLWSVYEGGWYRSILYWLPSEEFSKLCPDCLEYAEDCVCEAEDRCEYCDCHPDDCECLRCPRNGERLDEDTFPDIGCFRCRFLVKHMPSMQWECGQDSSLTCDIDDVIHARREGDAYQVVEEDDAEVA